MLFADPFAGGSAISRKIGAAGVCDFFGLEGV